MNVHDFTARFARVALASFLLLSCCTAHSLGQTKRELTLEWIFGPEGRTVASVPATAWLDDGFPMPAEILKPKTFRADRKYPVVMFIYGGAAAPQVTNSWQGDTLWNQLLLDAGYVVVKVDNRSATGISKELENTVVKRLGEAETPDLLSAARWLKKQAWVDPARVGVWGWSYGGYMTLN